MTTSETPTPLDIARQHEARIDAPVEARDGMFTAEQQAEVDRIIRDRIQRVEAKYAALDVDAAERRLAEIELQIRAGELQVLRNSIATRIGLSPEDRDLLLTGKDEAALELQAKTISDRWGLGQAQGNVAPREGHAVHTPTPQNSEVRQFVDELFGSGDVW